MLCPRCRFENRKSVSFCEECGAKLDVACPSCGAAIPPGMKFCGSCGQPLTVGATSAPRFASPESYTPKHLAEKILTSKSALEGERKQVTVLFCDLVNSTGLAERIGAEAMHALLNQFCDLALTEVHRFEGTINQFLGDGFMALFGAPIAHEDHARRAVLAALGIQGKFRENALRLSDPSGAPLAIRIGLNTGLVVVGAIGDNLRMDYTAVGDTTNLAARLQQAASPGSIYLSEATHRLVQGDVGVEALQGIHVKGKTEPLTAYRVTDLRPRRSPLGSREERSLTPFVGRDRELATLQELLDQAEHSHGQVVGIVAEPGVGKSRLLYEFRKSLANKRITYLEGRCVSYGSDIPYLPLLDIIRANCGITESDTPQAVGQKVHGALAEVGMDAAALAPYLLQLLGVKEGTEPLTGLTPEIIKTRTFDTLRRMSLQGSQRRQVIFVGEDLHWIDRPSEEYLASLVESLSGAAILLLTTYRPGYRPPWLDKSYATQLALHALSQQESLSVVQSVGQRVSLAEPVAKTILDRAEGNPFFLEELTRAVLELGEAPSAVTVPDTIQGVLMARIDRLPDKTKRVLQTASVLGREFSFPLLGAIWDSTGDLRAHLTELKRLEFLYERTGAGGTAYLFKHALTQDVAYESLLTSQRKALHAAAGQALETLYATRLEPVYDRLAYHYSRAEESRKAVEYLTRFALKATRGHAHEEAITAFRGALGHCERLPPEERDRSTVQLALHQAESLHYLGRRQETVDLLIRHHKCLERLHDPTLTGPYHFRLGFTYSFLGDRERASQNVMQAFAAATECNDQATMGRVSVLVAMERGWSGQIREGIALGQRAVALLEQTPERSWLGFAHYALAFLYSSVGDFELGLQAAARVAEVADAIGDRRLQTNGASVTGLLYAQMGETDAAIEACQRAIEISPDPFETALALGFLGYAYLQAEDPSSAVRILEQAVAQANQYRSQQVRVLFAIRLGEAYLANGETEKARELVASSLKVAREVNYQFGVGMAQRAIGRIAWASGATSEVEPLLKEALETFASIEAKYFVGLIHLDLAKFNYAGENVQVAFTHLNEARSTFKALRIPKYMDRVVQLLQEFGVDRLEEP